MLWGRVVCSITHYPENNKGLLSGNTHQDRNMLNAGDIFSLLVTCQGKNPTMLTKFDVEHAGKLHQCQYEAAAAPVPDHFPVHLSI